MHPCRRLGRAVGRFRYLAAAAAEETALDCPEVRCEACETWIPARHDRCHNCGHLSPRAVLGLSEECSENDVKAAARERIKAVHPDQGGSLEEFQRVKQARDRLLQAQKKESY